MEGEVGKRDMAASVVWTLVSITCLANVIVSIIQSNYYATSGWLVAIAAALVIATEANREGGE